MRVGWAYFRGTTVIKNITSGMTLINVSLIVSVRTEELGNEDIAAICSWQLTQAVATRTASWVCWSWHYFWLGRETIDNMPLQGGEDKLHAHVIKLTFHSIVDGDIQEVCRSSRILTALALKFAGARWGAVALLTSFLTLNTWADRKVFIRWHSR